MTPSEFEKLYARRLRKYARRLTREMGLPSHMREDLYQACWLVVGRLLVKWKPDGGLSAFNWCASQMKREMTAEFRRYHENPAYGWRREMSYFLQPLGDREAVAEDLAIDLKIDMARILNREGRSTNLERFLYNAENPNSGAEMAVEAKQTRQAVNHALRRQKERLAKVLADYQHDRPSDAEGARRGVAWKNGATEAYFDGVFES